MRRLSRLGMNPTILLKESIEAEPPNPCFFEMGTLLIGGNDIQLSLVRTQEGLIEFLGYQ